MNKKIFLTICWVVLCSSYVLNAHAYTERNLLQHRADEAALERVLVGNQAWVSYPAYTDRQGWEALMGENKTRLIKAGEKLLDYQWNLVPATAYLEYERGGDRNVMQNPYEKNRSALNTLMLAELAEGKGRFLDQLINGVYQSCEMTSWVLSAHLPNQKSGRSLPDFRQQIIDLGSGGYGATLAWVHYFFHQAFDRVNPVISLYLQKELKERILDPYMADDTMWWMAFHLKPGGLVNNWNPWCNSNVLQCFLLMENDKERLVKAVYRTMQSVDHFLNFIKADGACEEGPSYWEHAAGKLYDYLQILSDGTGGQVSLFDEPMVRRMGEYISRSYVGNGWVVNFADASAKGGGNESLIYRYGKAVGSEEMMQFAAYLLAGRPPYASLGNDTFRSLQSLLSYKGLSAMKGSHVMPDVTWYPETEFCYMKNKDGLFVAAKGGFNNESHNHNDAGTFSLYVDTTPVLIDAGVGTYTRLTFSSQRYTIWSMQSDYHNLPMINGVSQKFGQQYKANAVRCDGKRQIFSADIAAAYPQEAQVKSWVRSYALKGQELILTDQYTLKKAVQPNQLNFLTWGKVDLSQPGKVRLEVGGKVVEMTYPKSFTAAVEPIALDDPRLSRVWGKEIYRLTLKTEEKKLKDAYRIVVRKIK